MLCAPACALWPFFVRFSTCSSKRITHAGAAGRARVRLPCIFSGTLLTTIDSNTKYWCFFAANPVALRRLCEGRAPWQFQLFGGSGFDSRKWQSCFFLPEWGNERVRPDTHSKSQDGRIFALRGTTRELSQQQLSDFVSLCTVCNGTDEGPLATTAVVRQSSETGW